LIRFIPFRFFRNDDIPQDGDIQEIYASVDTDENLVETLERKVTVRHSLEIEDIEAYKSEASTNYFYDKFFNNDAREFSEHPPAKMPKLITE
jgi:hypothetical protein